MRNKTLVAILSATAITGGVFIGTGNDAQACWRSQMLSTDSAGQSPQSFNSTSASTIQPPNHSSTITAAGVALLGSVLAVGGLYLFRRRPTEPVVDAEHEFELPSTVVDAQESRELVGSRK